MTEEIMTLMIMMINVRSATLEELGQTTSCLSMSVAATVTDLYYFCCSERMEDRGEGWRTGEQEEEEEARLQHCRSATRFATGRDWS